MRMNRTSRALVALPMQRITSPSFAMATATVGG